MGDKGGWGMSALTGGLGMKAIGWGKDKLEGDDELPYIAPLPAPVDDSELDGVKEYTKKRIKSKKGRTSTILGSTRAPVKTTKKTILG